MCMTFLRFGQHTNHYKDHLTSSSTLRLESSCLQNVITHNRLGNHKNAFRCVRLPLQCSSIIKHWPTVDVSTILNGEWDTQNWFHNGQHWECNKVSYRRQCDLFLLEKMTTTTTTTTSVNNNSCFVRPLTTISAIVIVIAFCFHFSCEVWSVVDIIECYSNTLSRLVVCVCGSWVLYLTLKSISSFSMRSVHLVFVYLFTHTHTHARSNGIPNTLRFAENKRKFTARPKWIYTSGRTRPSQPHSMGKFSYSIDSRESRCGYELGDR